MQKMEWTKGWTILLVSMFLLGCVPSQQYVESINRDLSKLESDFYAAQKDVVLKKDIEAFQKETQKGFSDLKAEIKRLQSDLSSQIETIQSQLSTIQKEKEFIRTQLTAFQKEFERDISNLRKEDNLLKADLTRETQKVNADLALQRETHQSEIRNLSARLDEYGEFLKRSLEDFLNRSSKEMDRIKENTASKMRILEEKGKTFEEKSRAQDNRVRNIEEGIKTLPGWMKVLEERIKGMDERFKGMDERSKGLDEKISQIVSKQQELEKLVSQKEAPVEVKGSTPVVGDLYKDAYDTFQKGNLEEARKKFEAFLKQYPNTELSDNAQFWIGETYYLKKDFEKAILEYEKAIAKYPEGDKIPAALFKQALAFLELNDKANARNLLKRVIERYPRSEQAAMAKKHLEEIK